MNPVCRSGVTNWERGLQLPGISLGATLSWEGLPRWAVAWENTDMQLCKCQPAPEQLWGEKQALPGKNISGLS